MSVVMRFSKLFLGVIFFKVALIILSNYKDIHIHYRTFDEKQSKSTKQEMKITHNSKPRDNLLINMISILLTLTKSNYTF